MALPATGRVSAAAVRETVGFIGVVASLVFVGLQIRQSTAIARGQARQELAGLNQEWLILQSTDSVFSRTFARAWIEQGDSLTSQEASTATWSMRLNLRRLENAYFQFAEGLVDESALNSYGFQAAALFQSSRFRELWVRERNAYDPGFVRYFQERFEIADL